MACVTLLLIKGSLMAFRLEGANHGAAVIGAAACSADNPSPTPPPTVWSPWGRRFKPLLSEVALNGGGLNVKTQSSFAGGLCLKELLCDPVRVGRCDASLCVGTPLLCAAS